MSQQEIVFKELCRANSAGISRPQKALHGPEAPVAILKMREQIRVLKERGRAQIAFEELPTLLRGLFLLAQFHRQCG